MARHQGSVDETVARLTEIEQGPELLGTSEEIRDLIASAINILSERSGNTDHSRHYIGRAIFVMDQSRKRPTLAAQYLLESFREIADAREAPSFEDLRARYQQMLDDW